MDPTDLDQLANRLAREHRRAADAASEDVDPAEWRADAVLVLATHRDRRVIAPLRAILGGPTVGILEVRAAGLLADPALLPALVGLAAKRHPDDPDAEFWDEVAAAAGRCHPDAAAEAEEVEMALLAALQTSLIESGMEPVDIALAGEYPDTELVCSVDDRCRRSPIWNFDEDHPASPATLDRAFTLYRLANLARWL